MLAQKLFNDVDGWDPFLEDEATLWLLHYELNLLNIFDIIFPITKIAKAMIKEQWQ